ncbi:MAG: hypothetical protein ACN6OB_05220 [Chryseobacterium jejuense]|uniref:hypothetical protein n=1 Tax=Chryseobacterium jejuense TaxID=445960 RepID=UPI003D11CADC
MMKKNVIFPFLGILVILTLEETHFGGDNLIDKPYKKDNTVMDYIGCLEGHSLF